MLNACARWFFALTQRVLLREVLLGISRLTDSVKTGRFDNLVIGSLLQDPAVDKHPGLRQKLTDTVNAILAERLDLQYVRRVCQAMEKASKEVNPEGDPAVQYLSRSPEKIVIADPYLAFFFAWGLGSLDLPVVPPLARRSDDSTEGTP